MKCAQCDSKNIIFLKNEEGVWFKCKDCGFGCDACRKCKSDVRKIEMGEGWIEIKDKWGKNEYCELFL